MWQRNNAASLPLGKLILLQSKLRITNITNNERVHCDTTTLSAAKNIRLLFNKKASFIAFCKLPVVKFSLS